MTFFIETLVPRLDALKVAVFVVLNAESRASAVRVVDAKNPPDLGTLLESEISHEISHIVTVSVDKFLARYKAVARTLDAKWFELLDKLEIFLNSYALPKLLDLEFLTNPGTAAAAMVASDEECRVTIDAVTTSACLLRVERFPLDAEFVDILIEIFDFSAPCSFTPKPQVLRVDRVALAKTLTVAKLRSSRWHRLRLRAGETGAWSAPVEVTTRKL